MVGVIIKPDRLQTQPDKTVQWGKGAVGGGDFLTNNNDIWKSSFFEFFKKNKKKDEKNKGLFSVDRERKKKKLG